MVFVIVASAKKDEVSEQRLLTETVENMKWIASVLSH